MAEEALRKQLLKNPSDARALELSGDIAVKREDASTAAEMYRKAVEHAATPSRTLLDKWAQASMHAGWPFEAMGALGEIVERYPDHPQARFDLAGLATMVGQPSEALPALRWLARHGHGDPESLVVLADPGRVEPDGELCRKLMKRAPENWRPHYCLARLEALDTDWQAVRDRLEPVLGRHPDFVPAYTLYGRSLVELNEYDAIPSWQRKAPAGAVSAPEYWLVAASWAQHQGRHEEAARAYWEAIRLDGSGHPEALTGLLLNLKQSGHREEAEKVAEQITKYSAMRDALNTHFERHSRSQRAAMRVAEAMMDLGRVWESEGWARLAASLPEDRLPDIRQRYTAIRSKLTVETPWQLPDMMIANQIDLNDLPSVAWLPSDSERSASESYATGQFRFEDQAQQRGWIHTCEIAPETKQQGHWIHHSVGGGVGVIDFDLDGYPDLAAAMLDGNPRQDDSSPNRLFRNRSGQFAEVSSAAGYRDTGFSHGIAVGDYNDDGFPDIYDANYGRNRLYRNNGDGTFEEVSGQAGLSGEAWTTSVAIADIDGDGIADLYETAYCGGSGPYTEPCRNERGFSTCPPLRFEAEKDRVWRGTGDGTFVDATDRWMNQTSPGRGLGVVVGTFDERPGLDLYVANDMTVNHLWSAEKDREGFRLADLGAVRGLGFNGNSLSQASMGIAAGDPDRDGDTDFFLTHFSDEHNTYYEQVAPGLWTDRSNQVSLSQPSIEQLGFGTQWVDFDNNSTLELIVANGHVNNGAANDPPFRMPPQLFQRDSSGAWHELDRKALGDYFARDHVGRTLATVDVDRDGRRDVAITHLYEPVALLINRTETNGGAVGLELKATRGHRDAIGARVIATIGDQQTFAQVTAGDGYMCSNQRQVAFGTGESEVAENVTVVWPSGEREEFGDLKSGADYLLVEGSAEASLLQRHDR